MLTLTWLAVPTRRDPLLVRPPGSTSRAPPERVPPAGPFGRTNRRRGEPHFGPLRTPLGAMAGAARGWIRPPNPTRRGQDRVLLGLGRPRAGRGDAPPPDTPKAPSPLSAAARPAPAPPGCPPPPRPPAAAGPPKEARGS